MSATYNFGCAIQNIKNGIKMARKGWNGSDMYIYYVPPENYKPCTETAKLAFDGDLVPYGAYIAMKTAQNNVVPWVASHTDMLSEDWYIVE